MCTGEVSKGGVFFTQETPDMEFWPTEIALKSAQISGSDIEVEWADGKRSRYYPYWLREQCPCPQCHSEVTRETLLDIADFSLELTAKEVSVNEAGYLSVIWAEEEHVSHYHPGWLRENSYDDWARSKVRPSKPTWGYDFDPPAFDGAAVLENDDHLSQWLQALQIYGLTIVRNLPTDVGTIQKVADRIGLIRPSNFGSIFEVMSKPDADSNAYLSVALPLHMDLPFRELPPGIQFLHCLQNGAEGGDSIFVDTFQIAKAIQKEAPDVYEQITSVDYPFLNRSGICSYRHEGPLIVLDEQNEPLEARISTFITAPITYLPHDKLKKALAARHYLLNALKEDRFRKTFKMEPGDMVAFDNRRILHGRTEFYPNTGMRHLQGCYFDRDDIASALNMIERNNRRKKCGYV